MTSTFTQQFRHVQAVEQVVEQVADHATVEIQKSKEENFEDNSSVTRGVSLRVPRVYPNWKYYDIKKIFIGLNWGFIERVDLVPLGRIPKGRFKTAFVHFRPESWNARNLEAREGLKHMTETSDNFIKVPNDEDGHYWKVHISSAQRPDGPPSVKTQLEHGTNKLTVEIPPQVTEPTSPTYGPIASATSHSWTTHK